MREAMDETVRRGVPEHCARDFLLGHMNRGGSACPNTELALISGALQVGTSSFSVERNNHNLWSWSSPVGMWAGCL